VVANRVEFLPVGPNRHRSGVGPEIGGVDQQPAVVLDGPLLDVLRVVVDVGSLDHTPTAVVPLDLSLDCPSEVVGNGTTRGTFGRLEGWLIITRTATAGESPPSLCRVQTGGALGSL
jgi:hypothetical protein